MLPSTHFRCQKEIIPTHPGEISNSHFGMTTFDEVKPLKGELDKMFKELDQMTKFPFNLKDRGAEITAILTS